MMTKFVAWSVLLGGVWLAYQGVNAWESPWSVPTPAVLSVMPEQPQDCAKKGCL